MKTVKEIQIKDPCDAISIDMDAGKFDVDSKKLSFDCYYPVLGTNYLVRRIEEKIIALYEYYKLKSGEYIIQEILEVEGA